MNKELEVKTLLENYHNSLKEVNDFFKNNLGAMIAEIMQTSPRINSIGFTAYTPFFNDGDTCVYSVHDIRWINGINIDYDNCEIDYDWKVGYFDQKGSFKEDIDKLPETTLIDSRVIDKIQELLDSIPTETAESIFGDHVKVTIDREGNIKTEDYEHD